VDYATEVHRVWMSSVAIYVQNALNNIFRPVGMMLSDGPTLQCKWPEAARPHSLYPMQATSWRFALG
jgi:hypothetical protein